MYDRIELDAALRHLDMLLKSPVSEEVLDRHISQMSRNILDPGWMRHVFHSNDFADGKGGLDTAALCDEILSYRPLVL